jgi:hypothetical protein
MAKHLEKIFYPDICNIIYGYLMESREDVIDNYDTVILHLSMMFQIRQRTGKNKKLVFSYPDENDAERELDVYFNDLLTVLICVKDT